jgi:hypothetical protein
VNGHDHVPVEPGVAELAQRVDELTSEVAALRADLDVHRASLGRGLRTQRVAVVDGDGFERIVLVASPGHGSVAVNGRSLAAGSVVELFANDVDGRAHVGVALTEAGDVVSVLEALEGADARLWVEPRDDRGGPSA